jgi:hypothetical protein
VRQRDVAVAHGKVASLLLRLGKFREALAEMRKARDILARLLALAPDHAGWKAELQLFDNAIAEFEKVAQ